jgi:threonine/homoserine/homoserine lactone efflux protein
MGVPGRIPFWTMKEFTSGFFTGLTLQLAIGPVFLFIANLALQTSVAAGFAGVLAVTLVDFMYIGLAVFGIGRFLDDKILKKGLGFAGSFVLILLGILIIRSAVVSGIGDFAMASGPDLLTSFMSVFLLTLFNPLTIVFFTGIFTVKTVEKNYTKNQLGWFGLGAGVATFVFMGAVVIVFSSVRGFVPLIAMQILNGAVGLVLGGYGIRGLSRLLTGKNPE